MGTAYIAVTIEPREERVTFFQAEAIAEVEYHCSRGELHDWHVSKIQFEEFKWTQRNGKSVREIVAKADAPKPLYEFLMDYLDQDAVEEALIEQLTASGELVYADPGLRADYHASVL